MLDGVSSVPSEGEDHNRSNNNGPLAQSLEDLCDPTLEVGDHLCTRQDVGCPQLADCAILPVDVEALRVRINDSHLLDTSGQPLFDFFFDRVGHIVRRDGLDSQSRGDVTMAVRRGVTG